MTTKFSIIIPVYNVAPYLRECLDSVLAQTFIDWEAICVDDGSTDGSGDILDDYAARDSRFRVFHKKNGGVASARNAGLDVAKGTWIAFLDADDVWASWTLAFSAWAVKESRDIDVIRFDVLIFTGNSLPWDDSLQLKFNCEVENVSTHVDSRIMSSYLWGKVYRKDLVCGIRFRNYTVGEDLLFLTQCMLRAQRQCHVEAVCYGYRVRSGSAVHSALTVRKQRDRIGYLCDILTEYEICEKTVSRFLWRTRLNQLIEQFVYNQRYISPEEARNLWSEWWKGLQRVSHFNKVNTFQRFRIIVLLAFPYYPILYFLCVAPYLFKRRGLHR